MQGKWTTFTGSIMHALRCAVTDWFEDRAASKGAALAFYTLFSMAPILVLVIAIAGFFWGPEAARGELFGQLKGLVGSQGAEAIQLVLSGARNKAEGKAATIVASVLLLFGATTVFAELKSSLDEIWGAPVMKESSIWAVVRTRLLSFGLILVLGFLLMVSLVVSAALTVLENFVAGYWQQASMLLGWLAQAVGLVVIAALFAVIYKLLPRIKLSWKDVAIGAFGTAIMFALGKYAIGVYIGNSGVANSFGAAGSMIALLLWVYYSAQIFFLGAEFTRQYALQLGSLRHKSPEETGVATKPVRPAKAADEARTK